MGATASVPPGGSLSLPVSIVGEDPGEGTVSAWGRMAHEIGHELQVAGPPHPSDYNSHFEQMDGEYPAQTGVFERESNMGFPGWLPAGKYAIVKSPGSRENHPLGGGEPACGRARPPSRESLLEFRRDKRVLSRERPPAEVGRRFERRESRRFADGLRYGDDAERDTRLRRTDRARR